MHACLNIDDLTNQCTEWVAISFMGLPPIEHDDMLILASKVITFWTGAYIVGWLIRSLTPRR